MKSKLPEVLAALLLATSATQLNAQTYGWTTVAGTFNVPGSRDGTNNSALFNVPRGVVADGAGNLYVADAGNYDIRKLTPMGANWIVTTIAGTPGLSESSGAPVDGTNGAAEFGIMSAMVLDGNGNLYVQDYHLNFPYVRRISPVGTNWVVTTVGQYVSGWAVDFAGNFYTGSNQTILQLTPTVINGVPSATNFVMTTLAGLAGVAGHVNGTNNVARFQSPQVFAVDSNGVIYLSDSNSFRKVTPTQGNWVVTTLPVIPEDYMTLDAAGNTFASYNPPYVDLLSVGSTSWISIGGNGQQGNVDGTNTAAEFWNPQGVAVNSAGVVYVTDGDTMRRGFNAAIPMGALKVGIGPDVVNAAGASWRVDAGLWQTNANLVTNLEAGSHILSFSPIFGWATPTNQLVIIGSNQLTSASGTYAEEFGSVQVVLNPPAATNAGAAWQLDGGPWENSGAVLTNVLLGAHVISFSPIAGWITPSNQSLTLLFSGQTANLSAAYVALGGVQVTITPGTAASAGAQWQLDGGAPQASGTTLSNLSLGSHVVSFSPLNSWITPSNQTVNVLSGQTTNVVGAYIGLGSLQVNLAPAGAVSNGAQWNVDGGTWKASGAVVSNLVVGGHTVGFTNVPGWSTPTNQSVVVDLAETTVLAALYVQQLSALQVVLSPAGAVSAGAKWQVDGGSWENSGTTLSSVGVGGHLVSFSPVPGWTAPTNQPVAIHANQTTRITGIYQEQGALQVGLSPLGAITAGAQWQVDGGAWLASEATASGLSPGTHTVSFKPVGGWVTPASQSLTVQADQTTFTNAVYVGLGYAFVTIAGTAGEAGYADNTNRLALFDNPGGIAVDLSSNLYIADTGNSVIRQLMPAAGGWSSSTIAGLAGSIGNADGTNGQGRFDYPFGVAWAGALYVSDQVNSIIRWIEPLDANSFITTTVAGSAGYYGSADGTNSAARFYYPAGLAFGYDPIGGGSAWFVADQLNSVIRKITSSNVPPQLVSNTWTVTTIAGSAGLTGSADGAGSAARFYWPTGVAVDTNGNVFVTDTFNDTIRKIAPVGSNYLVTTISGTAGLSGALDGTNGLAQFDGPDGIAVDGADNIYVADSYSSLIRKITPVGANWVVNTIGGLAYNSGGQDGTNNSARFNAPNGLCVDANGTLYVADTLNDTIRLGTPVALNFRPFAITATRQAGDVIGFSWNAMPGSSYQIQYKTNVLQVDWMNLGGPLAATNSEMSFADTGASDSQRFYRVVLVSP